MSKTRDLKSEIFPFFHWKKKFPKFLYCAVCIPDGKTMCAFHSMVYLFAAIFFSFAHGAVVRVPSLGYNLLDLIIRIYIFKPWSCIYANVALRFWWQ